MHGEWINNDPRLKRVDVAVMTWSQVASNREIPRVSRLDEAPVIGIGLDQMLATKMAIPIWPPSRPFHVIRCRIGIASRNEDIANDSRDEQEIRLPQARAELGLDPVSVWPLLVTVPSSMMPEGLGTARHVD